MTIQDVEFAKLVIDETLYPRTRISAHNAACIREAIAAGDKMPPMVVDEKWRMVDGRHRYQGFLPQFRKNSRLKVSVDVKKFKTDAEFFVEAARLNAIHGQRMSTIDRVHFALRAKELGVSTLEISKAIRMKESAVKEFLRDRVATSKGGETKAIKKSIAHLKGTRLSNEQWEANSKLSGMSLQFHATQIVLLIENDFVDSEDQKHFDALIKLQDILGEYLASAKPGKVA